MSKTVVTVETMKQWLETNNFKFRESENDFTLNCPLCKDTHGKFGISKKAAKLGYWNCYKCNSNGKKFSSLEYAVTQKGSLKFKTKDVIQQEDLDGEEEKASTIESDFHIKYYKLLLSNKLKVKDYLINERKLSEECIKYFQVGARRNFKTKKGLVDCGEHVAIPYIRDGQCVNMKYRATNPEVDKKFKWRRETGGLSCLFNDGVIDNFDYDEIVLCHPSGTLIDTHRGQKKIEDIVTEKDKVFTHNGNIRKITSLRSREVNEEIVSIKPKYFPYETFLTKEHPVLVSEKIPCSTKSWKLTCKPSCPRRDTYKTLKCQKDYAAKFVKAGEISGDKHWLVIPINTKTKKIKVPEGFDNSSDFWFMVGFWLGDGTSSRQKLNKFGTVVHRAVTFYHDTTVGNRKFSAIDRIEKYFEKCGISFSKYKNEECNTASITVSHIALKNFLEYFYDFNREKTIPEEIISLDRELQKALLSGYWYADGHQSLNNNGNQLKISSTSLHLLKQVQKICLRFGSLPGIHLSRKGGVGKINEREVSQKQLFNIVFEPKFCNFLFDGYVENRKGRANIGHYFILDDKCYVSFEISLSHYNGTVYNVEVEDDHSYLSNMITFHNCESEIDCMSVWTLGVKNVIGLTTGAKAFKQSWYERLLRFKKIYLVLDADGAGQEGARLLARRLGLNRCFNVLLPDNAKDPNDYIKNHDKNDFEGLLLKATQFDVPSVKSLHTVLREVYQKRFVRNNTDVKGWEWPWTSLQEKAGSLKAGHLIVVAARAKVGKTSLALDALRRMASGKQKVIGGMYSCEMSLDTLGEKLITQVLPNLEHIDEITQDQVLQASQKLPRKRLHFYQPLTREDLQLDKVCQLIEEAVTRYDIKVFIFDNLHFLCRDEDEYTAVGKATQAFKLLAEKLRIAIVLITHPRKGNANTKLTPDDLKGSSSIFQDADLVVLLNREAVDPDDLTEDEKEYFSGSLSPNTEIDVIGRWTEGGRTNLFFNNHRGLFKEDGADYDKMREFMEAKRLARNRKD